ncbi:MAG: SDR family NAD(P)-dependent oxidoreductase [Alphaproteobacteria bacterium]
MTDLQLELDDGLAVIAGASGGIGAALVRALHGGGYADRTIALSRAGPDPCDVTVEAHIAAAAGRIAARGAPVRLVIDATGFLHDDRFAPEKSWTQLDPDHLARAFAINAIGPALLMKHLLPLLPKSGLAAFATISARVGSIGDNRLGGWYAYRASKAALNQVVRTAAVELRRRNPNGVVVALHPGTVETALSVPFAKVGLNVTSPAQAAERLIGTCAALKPADSGAFLDPDGNPIPW